MSVKYQKSVFIFRRDLRLEDNTGLITLLEQSKEVVPVFIFDERQADQSKNEYFSAPAFQFLINSLIELDAQLRAAGSKLYVFSGESKQILESLIEKDKIDAVFVNKDYTPFSIQRDTELAELCKQHEVGFEQHTDITLSPIEVIETGAGKKYTVFTPFKNSASAYAVPLPRKNSFTNYFAGKTETKTIFLAQVSVDIGDRELLMRGGRSEAIAILEEHQFLNNYNDRRNFPATHGTSRLSAHHKFGTISIRESYAAATATSRPDVQFIAELYWRDFYYYIAYHFPYIFKKSFLPWAEYLEWSNNKSHFKAWCDGITGVPIVDAGMRELNHTGWMHNRTRMIVASYLTKNLLINWQWGEKYFAQNLIDYDPAQNNGGWQWSASTGADPRPLRIFNPYLQAQKYDPQAEYIKLWVPELKNIDTTYLTNGKVQDFSTLAADYPTPIVDQKESYHRAMTVYKNAKNKWSLANQI